MKDPRRLLEGDGTDFERALLGAVADERPPADLERRMRIGIGLVGAGVGASAVAKAAPASWGQAVVASIVAAGLAVGGAFVAFGGSEEPEPPAPPSVPAPPPAPEPAPEAEEATVAEPAPEPVKASDLPAKPSPKAAEPAKKGATAPDVEEEIRLLDQARSAVRGGSSSQALALLKRYEQRFPRGQLRQEVAVLRMEALYQSGDKERASALGRKFLSEHPNSPHVERVERVTGK